jgi:hypothetical protein
MWLWSKLTALKNNPPPTVYHDHLGEYQVALNLLDYQVQNVTGV